LPRDVPPALQGRRQGAFVTLKERGQLRGCIGRIVHDGPLPQLVSMVAFEAAFRDPRFQPLGRQELDRVDVEISLLTPPRPVASPRDVVVGRDGVVLRKGGRSAVFLPQVAPEQGWTRDQMLDELCLKAGLPARCWTEHAELSTFQAEVFGEPHTR
jgi:AmmeMemoRadiSam system protein A